MVEKPLCKPQEDKGNENGERASLVHEREGEENELRSIWSHHLEYIARRGGGVLFPPFINPGKKRREGKKNSSRVSYTRKEGVFLAASVAITFEDGQKLVAKRRRGGKT